MASGAANHPGSSQTPINENEATSILLSHMFSGAVGSAVAKSVTYSLFAQDDLSCTFIAALDHKDDAGKPIDRYRVVVDRLSGKVTPAQSISLSSTELADAVLSATGHHIAAFSRFTDGLMSISYKVSVKEDSETQYIVQLRYHGDVASMNALMRLVSSTIDPHILPVPIVYPIADEHEHQRKLGMGIQITQYIPGIMGHVAYPRMSHEQRLIFVKKLALGFDAIWSIPLPERLIGELKAMVDSDGRVVLSVAPDRYYALGGPFSSVAEYLRAFIRAQLKKSQK